MQASIGCGLSSEYRGKGLMQEAMTALLDHSFSNHNVHRVYAETISENEPAIRLCESLGMRKEAQLVEHRYFKGRWWDTVIFALRHNEWNENS